MRGVAIENLDYILKHYPPNFEIVSNIINVVLTDTIEIRIVAAELLLKLDLSENEKFVITTALAEFAINSKGSFRSGVHDSDTHPRRVGEVLAKLNHLPYREVVVDAWIELARRENVEYILPYLQIVAGRNEFTAIQLDNLLQKPRTSWIGDIEDIYNLLFQNKTANIETLFNEFENGTFHDRIYAGYFLKYIFNKELMRPSSANRILNLLIKEKKTHEVSEISKDILIIYSRRFENLEEQLLEALRKNHENGYLLETVFSISVENRGLIQTTVLYANDRTLPDKMLPRIFNQLHRDLATIVELPKKVESILYQSAWFNLDREVRRNAT